MPYRINDNKPDSDPCDPLLQTKLLIFYGEPMNNQLKKLRLGLALFALPFVASASAQEQFVPLTPANTTVETPTYLEGSRSHTVALNRIGQLEGRINSGDQTGELNVYFVRDGEIVTRTTTQDGGYFIAEGLSLIHI